MNVKCSLIKFDDKWCSANTWKYACNQSYATGLSFFAKLKTTSSLGTLPKAFQTNTTCSFGFFVPRLFTKASFRHSLETKKPPICMGGFVERTGIEPVLPG